MTRVAFSSVKRRWLKCIAVMLLAWAPGLASAQTPSLVPGAIAPASETKTTSETKIDPLVTPASCSSCGVGSGAGYAPYLGGGPGCGPCNGAGCVPGRLNDCYGCCGNHWLGRLFCGLHQDICCPDPCYEPHWVAAAESAFFVDAPRPMTQTRIRWDNANAWRFPDRSEFFWAKIGGNGPPNVETGVRSNDLSLYTEAAIARFGAFVEIPYRSLDPEVNNHAAGFADMNVGTKALLFDSELLELTFQFRTFIPIGQAAKGLGTGHVSLEPSLLAALKLFQETYLQGQLSEWIPIGGDAAYAGAILHYHFSLNHVLFRILPDCPLIGTAEFNGYSFQDGAFTAPVLGAFQQSSGETFMSAGPGLRLVICDRIDFGVGSAFAISDTGPARVLRTEFRWRF